ncbi:Septum formation initiator [Aquiflexum balticum DSM 16537]|uniref:Septum formation initiator n=2 Tax=Aquiflexum TaxID=280472 RepID=A0A1W2H2S9_9BACT|nr:Septum formation initiator [Aquiflexum balticum DSM 16537]
MQTESYQDDRILDGINLGPMIRIFAYNGIYQLQFLYLFVLIFIKMKKYLKYTKNFYFLFTLFFVIWMVFIDSNDILTQYKLKAKLNELERQKEFYLERKEKIQADRKELMSNNELLEKFARERYLMKRKNEDLYVVVEE